MKKTKVLPALVLSLLAMTAPAFADGEMAAKAMSVNPDTSAMSAHGLNVSADFLYWKMREDGLSYGVKDSAIPAAGTTEGTGITQIITNGNVLNVEQKFKPGFRVGVGYHSKAEKMNGWDFAANWAHMHIKATDSASVATSGQAKGPFIFPALINPSFLSTGPADSAPIFVGVQADALDVALSAGSKVDLKLNLIDLELGKEYFADASNTFSLRPHVGLRIANVKQTQTADYKHAKIPANIGTGAADFVYTTALNSQKANGFGVRAGVDSEYGINLSDNSCLSVYGKIAASLLLTTYDVSNTNTLSGDGILGATPGTVKSYTSNVYNNKDHATKAVTDLDLGVQWEKGFSGNKYWLTLAAGWEQHVFFNHYRAIRFANSVASGSTITNHGDLSFSGLKLSGKFDF